MSARAGGGFNLARFTDKAILSYPTLSCCLICGTRELRHLGGESNTHARHSYQAVQLVEHLEQSCVSFAVITLQPRFTGFIKSRNATFWDGDWCV